MDAVFLSAEQIRSVVSMADAIAAVREGFIGLARGEFEMPPRTGLRDHQSLVMAAHHVPTASAIVKTMSLNFDGRDPAIVGTVSWNDLQRTGHLLADAATITAIRTAAASGVADRHDSAARRFDAHDDRCRGQAADQVRAVCAVRSLSAVTVVDRLIERAEGLAAHLRIEMPNLRIEAGTDVVRAVGDADVISCATTSTQPLFPLTALKPDVHVNAIGAFRPTMRELPDELLADAGVVHVDEKDAILEESGEVIHALLSGAIVETDLVEIGEALADGIVSRTGRTVFKTVGVAMQVWAIARLLAEQYRKEAPTCDDARRRPVEPKFPGLMHPPPG